MDGFERAEVKDSGDFEVYSVEEVWALVRAAGAGVHTPASAPTHARSKTGRQVHIPERPFSAEELAGRRQQDLYDAATILTAALCGLRRSEILGLRWRAVLWDQQAILVRRRFTEVGGDRLPKGQRVHSVPTARRCSSCCASAALQGDPQPDDRVFAGAEGAAMDGSALYRRYREIQTAAGVRPLRFHDLRHTFGTQAIASGAHVMDVKEWMGHRHLSTTMRYVHHQPRHEAAAAPRPALHRRRIGARRSCSASRVTSRSDRPITLDATRDDPTRPRKALVRGHFEVILPPPRSTVSAKWPICRPFRDAGGGTRTPDTRIMIPLL